MAVASWALTTYDNAFAALGFTAALSAGKAALLEDVVDAATGKIEVWCGRRLKSRVYASPKALRVKADGTSKIIAPEGPVTAVASLKWKDRISTTLTALDLTGIEIDGWIIVTPNDAAPRGTRVELEITAGYKSGEDDAHDRNLSVLEGECLRLVQIGWHDIEKHVGRSVTANTVRGDQVFGPMDLPADMQKILFPFKRV